MKRGDDLDGKGRVVLEEVMPGDGGSSGSTTERALPPVDASRSRWSLDLEAVAGWAAGDIARIGNSDENTLHRKRLPLGGRGMASAMAV